MKNREYIEQLEARISRVEATIIPRGNNPREYFDFCMKLWGIPDPPTTTLVNTDTGEKITVPNAEKWKKIERIEHLESRLSAPKDRAILKPEYDPADVAFNRAKPWEWQVPTAAPVDELAALRAENARLLAERDDAIAACNAMERERDHLKKYCTLAWDAIIERHPEWTSGVPFAVGQLIRILNDTESERDALRARIEAGRVMYGGMYGHQNKFEMWTFEHVYTDTMTARLIDIAPLSDAGDVDERKGEEDRRQEVMHPRYGGNPRYGKKPIRSIDTARWVATIEHARSNDRRRTPGTRADRKAGSNE